MSKLSEKEEFNHDCEVLYKTLCRFTLSELKKIVAEKFASITWEIVGNYIQENRLPLTNKNVAYFLYRFLQDKTPAKKLKTRLMQILLTEMRTHCNRRTWFTYEMKGAGVNQIMKPEQLMTRVKENCQESAITASCEVNNAENLYWIIVQEYKTVRVNRKKQGETQKRFKAPIYFAAGFKEQYVFTTSRRVSDDMLLSVTAALGYNACKQLRLSDKNIVEMLKALKLKEGQAAANTDFEIPSFVGGEPEISQSGGVNFIGLEDRARFVDQRFGEEPPILSNISLKVREKFTDPEIPELDNSEFRVQVKFKSENVWETIKSTLTNTDCIDFPPPMFMEQAIYSGKSQILLVSKDNTSA